LDSRALQQIVDLVTDLISEHLKKYKSGIPVGISNRHVHLSASDRDVLYGENYRLTRRKDLKQPGQYACDEVVNIKGPKGEITKVRVLGPERKQTQVEISQSDCIKLGVNAPLRESGDLKESSPITIIGPKGTLSLSEGAITAQRHIHMSVGEAEKFGVQNGQIVSVKVNSPKGGTYDNVLVRSGEAHSLEMHIDTDEANAMGIRNDDQVELIQNTDI
jgi:Propanediol utilization protein